MKTLAAIIISAVSGFLIGLGLFMTFKHGFTLQSFAYICMGIASGFNMYLNNSKSEAK